ncbi:MAG: vWA domain-containing protein [Planctomycetota bacterium]
MTHASRLAGPLLHGFRSKPIGKKDSDTRTGGTLVLILIALPALLALIALAINVVHVQTLNTEVQIAADAAARAAAREYVQTADKDLALAAARDAAARNPVGPYVLPLNMEDLDFGVVSRTNKSEPYTFSMRDNGNAVRVETRSLASNSQISLSPYFNITGSELQLKALRSATAAQPALDISLVIDRSGSMAYSSTETADYPDMPDAAGSGWSFGMAVPSPSRWLDLIEAVRAFDVQIQRIGLDAQTALTLYNNDATLVRPLNRDVAPVFDELNAVSDNFISGATNIGGGMTNGTNEILNGTNARDFASKVVIVMTDGRHNSGKTPESAAQHLKKNHVVAYTITFSNEADQSRMRTVADRTGGAHYHAVTATELAEVFREIARNLPSLIVD